MIHFSPRTLATIALYLLTAALGPLDAALAQQSSVPVFVILRGGDDRRIDEFAACPNISGITLYFGWSVIEPQVGAYEFSRVTSAVKRAQLHNKQVNLALLSGRWSPPAVLQTARTMHWAQKDGYVEDNVRRRAIAPVPWDPTYVAAFSKVIAALGDAMKNERLNSVAITGGSNTNGIEMDLIGSDAELQKSGFGAAKYIAAWRHFIDAYAAAFPGEILTLAVHNQFGQSRNQDIPAQIETYARWQLGRRFYPTAFAFTGASWFRGGDPYVDLLMRYQQNNHFGLQSLTVYSKTKDTRGFQLMIERARQLHPAWLEIWPDDVRQGYWPCK
jgi:hypothetical protein